MTTEPQIRFDDGAGYERYMGKWSQLVGEQFLGWLKVPNGLRWLDVGCGNGAFTEMIVDHCAPSSVDGVDPSEAQITFARTRPSARLAQYRQGDAMALPYADDSVDVAVMPLVIFFVPQPARGIAEMARVVAPDGYVTAYAWDMEGGGFPYHALQSEIRAMGITVPSAPSASASRLDVMHDLWTSAGLENVATHVITVERSFANFDDYWNTVMAGPSVTSQLKAMSREQHMSLQDRLHALLPADATGRITYSATANAVQGRVPARR